MRTLVTGGAGFIGSHLVDRLLTQGEEVVAVDDLSTGRLANLAAARAPRAGKFQYHRLDITSSALDPLIERTKPEVIFHLAAQVDVRRSVLDPMHDATINVLGTLNLLQSASRRGVRKVVFTSSGGCIYGEPRPDQLPVRESHAFNRDAVPESPYGVSKKIVYDYFRYYARMKDLDFTALALANVFGPRQEPAGEVGLEGQVVAIFCRRMLERRPCTIYGSGRQTRDFVFVDDVVAALLEAATKASGELVNVGTGVETSINDLHSRLAALTSAKFDAVHADARPGELERIAVDPTKASKSLAWQPQTSLENGLKQTVSWFQAAR